MYNKKIKKTLYVLNIDNYSPAITDLTYPVLQTYAERIGADFFEITTRKFPNMPPVYEKMQIYELAQEHNNDWNIYVDSDVLIHPECPDFTTLVPKDTVMHHGADYANVRWDYDRYFLRDGRNIGSCNWLTVASDLCIELWKPLDDITYEEALSRIHPTIHELSTIIKPSHLIDDFTLSRNIAKYGLKFQKVKDILVALGMGNAEFFYHEYLTTNDVKIINIREILKKWRIG